MSERTSEAALAAAVAILNAAYPRQNFPPESTRLYTRMLADLPGEEVAAAVERLIRRSTWLPSIAEIREEVINAQLGLPSEPEAWSMINDPGRVSSLPDTVRESMNAVGGIWTIRTSEIPTTVRAQFRDDYNRRRRTAIEQATGALPTLPAPPVRSALPEPDPEVIRPRPVYARWLRRRMLAVSAANGEPDFVLLAAPTGDEVADAITVLAETDEPSELHTEALKIMDDYTAAVIV